MNWFENTAVKYLLVAIVILVVIIAGSTIAAFALSGKSKKRPTSLIPTSSIASWLTSPIINGLWAIAGLAFAYWLLSQIWPAFWEKWSSSAGFWWLPVALVAGFWLIGKKGGQAPTVAVFIIGIATLAVMFTSCNSMRAVHKEKVKVSPTLNAVLVKNQRPNERTIFVHTGTNTWSEPVIIPFGSKFMLNLRAPSLIKKNDKSYTYNGRAIFEPNGQESLGHDVRSLAFIAIGKNVTNEVLIWDVR